MKSPLYLIMTVGKTHSGKTTFAKQLHKKLPAFSYIETDDIVPSYVNMSQRFWIMKKSGVTF